MNSSSTARKFNGESPNCWSFEVNSTPSMPIRQVAELVASEFPSVTQPKLRLLKTHGIVCPARCANNGYRAYSLADTERTHYALRQQRDSYLPLAKIGRNLALLDCGEEPVPLEPITRMVVSDGEMTVPRTKRATVRQATDYTSISSGTLERMVAAKLIAPGLSGRFSVRAVTVMHTVMQLEAVGIEPRNLRSTKSTANSVVDLVDKVVGPARTKNTAVSKDRARQDAHDLVTILASLVEALTMQGVEETSRHSEP